MAEGENMKAGSGFGLALSRRYYEEFGIPMLESFSGIRDFLAVGLAGSGSECFGYDDEVSRDHDFEPGFVLFLPSEKSGLVSRRDAFLLERAYDALPREFEGLSRSRMNPVGGRRRGPLRTEEFFASKCGSPDGRLTARDWLTLPEHALAEAVNGEIFADPFGEVTEIRRRLAFYPEDIRLKKLAGALLLMKQAGIYNYPRILSHGEEAAAQLAVFGFVRAAMGAVFLLNRRYRPYYKWQFRAMREIGRLGDLADSLEFLMTTGNGPEDAKTKNAVIADASALILSAVREDGLAGGWAGDDPEEAAYAVNAEIRDAEIRNLHVLAGAEGE